MAKNLQIQFDDAVFAYTTGDYAAAVAGFEAGLAKLRAALPECEIILN